MVPMNKRTLPHVVRISYQLEHQKLQIAVDEDSTPGLQMESDSRMDLSGSGDDAQLIPHDAVYLIVHIMERVTGYRFIPGEFRPGWEIWVRSNTKL